MVNKSTFGARGGCVDVTAGLVEIVTTGASSGEAEVERET